MLLDLCMLLQCSDQPTREVPAVPAGVRHQHSGGCSRGGHQTQIIWHQWAALHEPDVSMACVMFQT